MGNKNSSIMVKGERTVLSKANNESYSLRTTVPKGIASQFELKEGNSLLWEIRPTPDGKGLFIVVTPENGNVRKKAKGK